MSAVKNIVFTAFLLGLGFIIGKTYQTIVDQESIAQTYEVFRQATALNAYLSCKYTAVAIHISTHQVDSNNEIDELCKQIADSSYKNSHKLMDSIQNH